MTVEELRALLKDYDASAQVVLKDSPGVYMLLDSIAAVDMIARNDGTLRAPSYDEMKSGECESCVWLA